MKLPLVLKKISILEAFRFCIVGVIATAVHYGTYLAVNIFLSVNISYTIGFLFSFCMNYLLSNYFTFKTKPTIRNGLGFAVSHLVNYLLHIILLNLFLFSGFSEAVSPIMVFMIVIPVNFLLVRFFLKKYSRHEKSIDNDSGIQ